MPSSSIHMSVYKTINKKLKRGEEFLIGNIAPDCWRHSLYHINKEKSHFINNGLEDYKEFYKKYKKNLNNDFTLGYLTHLMTDNYWKVFVVPNYKINNTTVRLKDNTLFTGTSEEIKELLHNNNQIATYHIAKHYDLKLLNENPKIQCNVEEIDLSGLSNTLKHINKINFQEPFKELDVYDINDIYNYISNCSDFILEELEKMKTY